MVTRSIETAQRKGRRPQLRHPQAAARVRRRRQRPAQGAVLAAQRSARSRQRGRDGREPARRRRHEMFNTFVPPESVEEQWDVPALQKALEADWQIQLPLTEMLEKEPNITDEDLRERVVAAARRTTRLRSSRWAQVVVAVRALDHAAGHRHALARAPVLAGLPAPGHPSARLRTEEPQAGNTSAKPSSCSPACWTASATMWCGC